MPPWNTRNHINLRIQFLDKGGKTGGSGETYGSKLGLEPNAHMCQDWELNQGLAGAKQGKIRYANPLNLLFTILTAEYLPDE